MLIPELPSKGLRDPIHIKEALALQSSTATPANHSLGNFANFLAGYEEDGRGMKEFEHGNHACKHCKKEFPSGRALGGHMRTHGSLSFPFEDTAGSWKTRFESTNSSNRKGSYLPSVDLNGSSSSSAFAEESPVSSLCIPREPHAPSRKVTASKVLSKGEDEFLENSDDPDAKEDDGEVSVKGTGSSVMNYSDLEVEEYRGHVNHTNNGSSDIEFPSGQGLNMLNKAQQLYTLRRNPKPSKRFEDQEYAVEMVASAAAARKSGSVEKGYVCTECGKDFASSKALFGHMRCHPERDWRGIHRPKTGEWRNSPSLFGNLLMDLDSDSESDAESIEAAYLNGEYKSNLQMWMTGKRSKRSRHSVKSLRSFSRHKAAAGLLNKAPELTEETDMADCLIMLAYAAGEFQEEFGPAKKKAAVGFSMDQERSKQAKSGSEDVETESEGKDKIGSFSKIAEDKSSQFEDSDEASEDEEAMELERGDGDEEDSVKASYGSADSKLRYECTSCKRIFKSHQALGGHRASHKKVKGCFARAHEWDRNSSEEEFIDENPLLAHPTELQRQASHGDADDNARANIRKKPKWNTEKKIKLHQCSICYRIFPTGQALGGHKRCHWGGGASSENSNPQLSPHKQQLQDCYKNKTNRADLLDLNLLPLPEEEADDSTLDFRVSSPNITTMARYIPLRAISSDQGTHIMDSSTSSLEVMPRNSSNSTQALNAVASPPTRLGDKADSSAFTSWVHHNLCDQVSSSSAATKDPPLLQ